MENRDVFNWEHGQQVSITAVEQSVQVRICWVRVCNSGW